MKCPNCKGDIAGDYKGQTCPSCGEPLPEKRPILVEWGERIAGFTEDRGFIFWLVSLFLFFFLLGALEHLFGFGQLFYLYDHYKFISVITLLYSAGHLQLVRNINSTVRPGYPGPYWTDRLIIKKFRKGTNLSILAGFITSLIIVGPLRILELLPAYVLIISLFTALFWSIESFRVDDREFMDGKVHSYFEFLGVKRLRDWRKSSGAYMIAIVVSGAVFYGLMQVHGLWWLIKQNPTLNGLINTVNGLFSWMPQLLPHR